MSPRLWSVVSRRLLGITWQDHITNIIERTALCTCCQRDHISAKTVHAMPPCHVSRMPPSADAYKVIYQDIPSDWRRRPGRPRQSCAYTEICSKSILTWTMFLNLLSIVYCGGDDLLHYAPFWCMLLMMMLMCRSIQYRPITLQSPRGQTDSRQYIIRVSIGTTCGTKQAWHRRLKIARKILKHHD